MLSQFRIVQKSLICKQFTKIKKDKFVSLTIFFRRIISEIKQEHVFGDTWIQAEDII